MNRLVFFLLLFVSQSGAFAAVYKCEQDGKVAYQASPCPNGSDISGKVTQSGGASSLVNAASRPSGRKCANREISLSFRDAPVWEILAIIADYSGNKPQFDRAVSGSGAFYYDCVAWDSVLQDIAMRHNLIAKVENGILSVRRR